ncbi:type 11 methyltransferase [Caballeronia cordobensis]|uniref:Type 11 methyltransferase n=1 Tax=Caballeronia cordobensis TaxID=1353886 RepID=A0A158HUX5_CABCO|nr:methyltransferase domain-containing protein [Caballeronia cordobensis]SAL48185.1 type 11 methyltransferase [Caballeronia cordobensis]
MERLEFGGDSRSRYIAIEAAIHIARYLTVKDLCSGRKVLDVACGEGYGSWLISKWGAKSVLGVDISEKAVANAKKRFKADGLTFECGSGEKLAELAGPQQFDLIVSMETIEHVDDPELFLENIKSLASDNATIVISAPNDYWYYDRGGFNEFHKRKFTLEEFKALTEKVLGKAQSWQLGTLGIGFSIAAENGGVPSGNAGTGQDLMLEFKDIDSAVFVPSQIESDVLPPEAAFYVGVWGKRAIPRTMFAGYPVSMNLGRQALFPRDGIWAIKPDATDVLRETTELQRLALKLQQTEADLHAAQTDVLRETTESQRLALKLQQTEDGLHAAQTDILRETTESQRLALKLQQAEAGLHAAQEELHFAKKENERLGMSRRAAQAEVASVWRALEKCERERDATTTRFNGEVQELSEQLDSSHQEIRRLISSVNAANAHLAGVPWNIVRAWWMIRKFVPDFVLRFVGLVLNSMRRSHAR